MTPAEAPAQGLTDGACPRVRTIPPSIGFLDRLADRLHAELARPGEPFALADALVLVPNRRAARALIETFAARGAALLLPAIRPLGDIDDEADVWGADSAAFDIPAAIDPLRRRLELARLIRARREAEGGVDDPVGAIAAADELCALLDSAAAADGVDWSRLPGLVTDHDLAKHWAHSAAFLEIIATYWPQRLAADGLADPAARRTALLDALAASWTRTPPDGPVIIAGSTGSVAAVRRLMRVVCRLPRGCVVLPGLDCDLDEGAWAEIDDQHPQHALKETLATLGVERGDVPMLAGGASSQQASARGALIREALAPATTTADWLTRLAAAARPWGPPDRFVEEACAGLTLLEAPSEEAEAAVIALALREALETPRRTAALVTPDTRLAQRVAAKLRRWGVEANVSAGAPLSETPQGVLARLLAELAEDEGAPVPLAGVLKHALAGFDQGAVRTLERMALRGPRRHADLNDLETLAKNSAPLIQTLRTILAPFSEAFAQGAADVGAFAGALADAMQRAAGPDVWAGRIGEAMRRFLQELAETQDALGVVHRSQAARLLAALLRGRTAPHESGGHPRIAIWGPLEARLQHRDLIVLGGLNEGAWPAPAPSDPFLSRSLREALGLPSVEARIGLAAHDFAQLANAETVLLTRAARAGGAPTIASRWVWRLRTLAEAANAGALAPGADHDLLAWAEALDKPRSVKPIRAPRPRPAASGHLITRLSVTDVEKLVRDPYAVYAKRILGLDVLRPIGASVEARDLGDAVHKALELFPARDDAPDAQCAALLALIDEQLDAYGFPTEQRAAARARLSKAAREFVDWAAARRRAGFTAFLEKKGEVDLDGCRLRGIADRIEIRPDGVAEITDFKTGRPPTDAQVNSGLSPQLLIEAAMLARGVFAETPAAQTDTLIYWRFAGGNAGPQVRNLDLPTPKAAAQALTGLAALLAHYALPQSAFLSKPRVEFITEIDDYDHLARRKEWAEAEAPE